MDLINPMHNAPMLRPPSPTKRHSRSPSASPTRYSPISWDPLLRCLSPTSTLQAFAGAILQDRSASPRRRTLEETFKDVSELQKELGCKAAQACLDIRGWTHELESWEWPGTFDEVTEPARKRVRMSIMSVGSLASGKTAEDDEEEHWGCLPAAVVMEYDERIEEISMQLDDIDLEELKNFTLQAHNNTDRAEHIESISESDMRKLDDFTAIVTATIMQTLPFSNRLTALLDTWSARLSILKDIPSFIHDLERLRTDLDHGWAAVAVSMRKNGTYASLGSDNMQEMQSLINARMTSLGQRLDGFLDLLEGRQDTVPERFLDKFEDLEQQYADWVVLAQRRVLGDELKEYEAAPTTPTTARPSGETSIDRARTPSLMPTAYFDRARSPAPKASAEVERAKSPMLDGIELIERARTPTIMSNANLINRAITPTIRDASSRMSVASLVVEGDYLGTTNSRIIQEDDTALLRPTLQTSAANSSLTALPQIAVVQEPTLEPSTARTETAREVSPTRSARHVPIILPIDGDGSEYKLSPTTSPNDFRSAQATGSHEPASVESTPPKADLERHEPVQSSKSPAKSHEHTGNAFTRLFRRDKKSQDPDQTQPTKSEPNVLQKARRSISRKRSTKHGDSVQWGGRADSHSIDRSRPTTSGTVVQVPKIEQSMLQHEGLPIERGRSRHEDEDTLRQLNEAMPAQTIEQRPQTAITTATSKPLTYQPKGFVRPPTSPKGLDFPENWPLDSSSKALLSNSSARDTTGSIVADDKPDAHSMLDNMDTGRASSTLEGEGADLRTVRSMAAIGSDDFHKMFIDDFPQPPTSISFAELDQMYGLDSHTDDTTAVADRTSPSASMPATDEDTSTLNDAAADTAMQSIPGRTSVPIVTSSMLGSNGRQDDLSVARAISIEGLRRIEGPPPLPDQNYKERYMASYKDERNSSLPMVAALETEDAILTPDDDVSLHDADVAYFRPASSHRDTAAKQAERAISALLPAHTHGSVYPPPLPEMPSDEILSAIPTEDSAIETRIIKRASTASIKAHLGSEIRSIDVPARKRSLSRPEATQDSSETHTPALDSMPDSRRSSNSHLQRPLFSRGSTRSGAQSPTGSIDTPNFSRLRSSSVDTADSKPPLNTAMSKRRKQGTTLETIKPSAEYVAVETRSKHSAPADEFDRHVSEVLDQLPAAIRFRTREGVHSSASSPGSRLDGRLKPKNMARRSSGAGLTLTPAEMSPRKTTNTEPGIKLYHLTQVGRDDPIKLFVRLVGENDRVMVRVGGGWADLADFLKQYAEHHGSRTVSGSGLGFELQSHGSTPAGSRRTSGAALSANKPKSTDNDTPRTGPETPISPVAGVAELPGSDVEAALNSVNSKLQSQIDGTGGATPGLTPRSSNGDLKKSKEAMSDQKARWVKTMLEKAKKETSGSKNKPDSFTEMGKIGSTRRVIFRSAAGVGANGGKK